MQTTASDNSAITTVTITVRSVNDAPEADADAYETDEDTELTVDAPGVLAGDTDSDGDDLTAELVSGTANGDLDLDPDGSFTYTPDADFSGTDTFTYRACDDADPPKCSDPTTVTITVNAVNDRPVARDDSAATDEDTATSIDVLLNDTDAEPGQLSITDLSDPAHGTATVEAGRVRYTPDADYSGPDSFTYRASDGDDSSAPATVTINVRAVNDAPDADADAATTDEDTPTSVNVLQNDTDVDSGALTITNVSDPANGSAEVVNGQVRYSPEPDFNGTDSFTYRACDDANPPECSDPTTVTITVNAVNDRPEADDDAYATDEDTELTVDAPGVLAGDTDADDDDLHGQPGLQDPPTATSTSTRRLLRVHARLELLGRGQLRLSRRRRRRQLRTCDRDDHRPSRQRRARGGRRLRHDRRGHLRLGRRPRKRHRRGLGPAHDLERL